jgi:predicted CXXCH cytochrome family protein
MTPLRFRARSLAPIDLYLEATFMPLAVWLVLLVPAILLLVVLSRRSSGRVRAILIPLVLAAAIGGYRLLQDPPPPDPAPKPGIARPSAVAVTSSDCSSCHQREYKTWFRTFHRTMTREATPDNVKGDFANAVNNYQSLVTRFTRENDVFYMETVDPEWARQRAQLGDQPDRLPPERRVKYRVDRLIGSHWMQECLHREPNGRYMRLPVLYHIVERRWVHTNGAFLAPDSSDFWAQCRKVSWNNTCLYCHNTEPIKNPIRGEFREVVGFETAVTELGIACAACHGPGVTHVQHKRDGVDLPGGKDDVVHPAHLSIARRDEICARCHGALVPKPDAWDPHTHRDPYVPGTELKQYNHVFWSEAEQANLARGRIPADKKSKPEPTDGRFWGDGTPLTTALEYNGMALSGCYEGGHGKLSCLSCHTMHGDDPNYLLKPRMKTNEACFQCHSDYRDRLAEHTKHPVNSAGSLCYNCHMPHQVYSLLDTHRSHRIQVPDLGSSLGTGKPHACNLCHLDKSLGWTKEQLGRWPNGKKNAAGKLSSDEETISSAVLTLSRGDARSRVVVAGAFSNPAARQASGHDWFGPVLTRLLEDERYPAVRYLAHRGLRAAYGEEKAGPYDYLALRAERTMQLKALQTSFDAAPIRRPLPNLPMTPLGLPDENILGRLRGNRQDPDLTINE